MVTTKAQLIAAADAKLAELNARYKAEPTPENRAARDEASRERSAFGYKSCGFASRAGQRQAAERRAMTTRRTHGGPAGRFEE